jgi:hypothetical protein
MAEMRNAMEVWAFSLCCWAVDTIKISEDYMEFLYHGPSGPRPISAPD